MKKLVSLALVLCMCMALLAGCGSDAENSSSESSISSNTEASENSESADTAESETDTKELPNGTVKDSIESQAAKLKDGFVESEVVPFDVTGDFITVSVKLNSTGYKDEEDIANEFVSFAENVCKDIENDFPYSSVEFMLYVDNSRVASIAASLINEHFTIPLDAVIRDNNYQIVDSKIKQSSYFKSSSENSDANQLINDLENPYDSGFPADPSHYPPEEYGEPITTGDFGEALKKLNEEFSTDEGREVYAYMPPDSDCLEIHFSPSDKAIEEKDDQTVALEYVAMAQLIAENYPKYSDTYGDTIAIYLGDLTALISVTYSDSTPYTSLTVFSQDTSLNADLNLAYDTTLGKYDIGLLTD